MFGEIYVDLTERLTFTGGLRYNDDKKDVTARTTLISFLNPYANDGEPFDSPIHSLNRSLWSFDADPRTPGEQLTQFREVGFDEITGRAVLDYEVTPDNSIYASYVGAINPGVSTRPFRPFSMWLKAFPIRNHRRI